jgi:hypothetical protein
MTVELNAALFLKLEKNKRLAKSIIRRYNISSVKQFDPNNKVQLLLSKEHKQLVIEYLNRVAA